MAREPTFLGIVRDVKGATIRVALDAATVSGLSFVNGASYRIGQVGSFIRIPMGYVDLFGVVSQVGAGAAPEHIAEPPPGGTRWMTAQLVGEARGGAAFERGVSQYPTVDDEVHLVTADDLAQVYGRPDGPHVVRVGSLSSAPSVPALVDVNRLVTRHSAVLGATGAGKSTLVARLIMSLSGTRYPSARIVVFDIHGEYARALAERATIFRVTPDPNRGESPLYIPYWALTFEELLPLTFGALEDAARAGVLDKVAELKRAALQQQPRRGVSTQTLTVDSPVPFSIHELWLQLHRREYATYVEDPNTPTSEWAPAYQTVADAHGDALQVRRPLYRAVKNVKDDPEKIRHGQDVLNVRRPLAALESRLLDPRLAFLFSPGPWKPDTAGMPDKDLDTLLDEWLGSPKPVTILDLSGVPRSILNNLLGALLRVIYDALFWARNLPEGGRERPLLLVLEEAHAYLGAQEQGAAATAVRRIAKEGRKYGLGVMIVSQRPSEIDPTILSQCGTLFAMRLSNDKDRAHVTSAAMETLAGLFEMLPILRTGEGLVVGEAVSLPVRTLIDPPAPDRRPDSGDPKVVVDEDPTDGFAGPGGWNQPRDPQDYAQVVEVWRRQNPRVERSKAARVSPAPAAPARRTSRRTTQ
jgi:hypothetical protein